ncbi:hypothetical protein [Staphylococcus aureus]|uniref:hypothetical protein n=1 Tax=Staphylococcus aureus TaxID=1280 RepID=UPI0020C0EB72|nr:hypothetical protein [Staphylococcus aureus]
MAENIAITIFSILLLSLLVVAVMALKESIIHFKARRKDTGFMMIFVSLFMLFNAASAVYYIVRIVEEGLS